jgi:hypothetical protein
MHKLLAADTYLIETTQEAYLWLWDRTGVYVATLIFSAVVCSHVVHGLDWGSFIGLAIMGAFSTQRYIAQQKDLRRLNLLALGWRTPWLRLFYLSILFACVVADIAKFRAGELVGDIFFALWNCLACVQVRDRDPKDLFQTRKLAVQS